MKSGIFFTDLDGTLLTTEKKITPNTRTTLDKLTAAGHRLALVSGRPLKSILEVKETLGLTYPGMFLVGFNGGLIFDFDKKETVLEHRLSYEDTRYFLETAKAHGIHGHTYTDDAVVANAQTRELDFYQKSIHLPSLITDDITGSLKMPPFKCLAIHLTDKSCLKHLKEDLLFWAEERISLTFSSDYLLEAFPAQAGKGNAVTFLCEKLGIPLSDCLAAGDQDNDISMLQAAGLGVAMQNGSPQVKAISHLITPCDNNHDGLVPVLTDFFGL